MKRLPYIDEHAIALEASAAETWAGLVRTVCSDPDDPSTVPFGFTLEEATAPRRLALIGRHWFAAYRLVFEVDPQSAHSVRVRALTYAAFPGLRGRVYRGLVIGSGGHKVVVRRILRRIAAATRYSESWNSTTAATDSTASRNAANRSAAEGAASTE